MPAAPWRSIIEMRIVQYLNQFFAGIGGEDRAETPPDARAGAVGPGLALGQILTGEAEIAGTVWCGDGPAAMAPGNAAGELHRREILIVPTAPTAIGMKDALAAMARLATRLGRGETLGPAAVEGYLPRGRRMNARAEAPASERALHLLL